MCGRGITKQKQKKKVRETHLDVATLQSEAEASFLIFNKVQSHLRVTLLLQVGDDGLSHQFGVTHHVKNLQHLDQHQTPFISVTGTLFPRDSRAPHLVVFTVHQSQFEAVLCGVDGQDTGATLAVQTVHAVAPNTSHIDGQVQSPDDSVITEKRHKYKTQDPRIFPSF